MTISRVFVICNAYEIGYVQGLQLDELANPYTEGTEEFEGYSVGYAAGAESMGVTIDDKTKGSRGPNVAQAEFEAARRALVALVDSGSMDWRPHDFLRELESFLDAREALKMAGKP